MPDLIRHLFFLRLVLSALKQRTYACICVPLVVCFSISLPQAECYRSRSPQFYDSEGLTHCLRLLVESYTSNQLLAADDDEVDVV